MADDVKTTVTVTPAAAKPAEVKPAAPAVKAAPAATPAKPAAKPAAKKPAAKKPAAKKAAAAKPAAKKAAPKAAAKPVAKKTTAAKPAVKKATTAKPAAKKAAPKAAAKTGAKPGRKPAAAKTAKTAAKPAPAAKGKGGRKKAAPTLDTVTIAIWKRIGKASVRAIEAPVGIQVNVRDIGTFFIAVKADGNKKQLEVAQANYDDRAGTFETSYEEIMKIAGGKYNFLDAVTKGKAYYYGDVAKAVAIAGLFK